MFGCKENEKKNNVEERKYEKLYIFLFLYLNEKKN